MKFIDILYNRLAFDYFAFDNPGIGRNLVYMFVTGLLWFVVLFALEYKWFDLLPRPPVWMRRKKDSKPVKAIQEPSSLQFDSDVVREHALVQEMPYSEIAKKSLVLKELHKKYGDFQAVNSLSVAINS